MDLFEQWFRKELIKKVSESQIDAWLDTDHKGNYLFDITNVAQSAFYAGIKKANEWLDYPKNTPVEDGLYIVEIFKNTPYAEVCVFEWFATREGHDKAKLGQNSWDGKVARFKKIVGA